MSASWRRFLEKAHEGRLRASSFILRSMTRRNLRIGGRLRELFGASLVTPGMKEVAPQRGHDPQSGWSISPFPARRRFAFTIVHDADSAYSRRLEPLFEVFDELGFKITVTVFPLWADWARDGDIWRAWNERDDDGGFFAPQAVPLMDEKEREFYKRLAARGHEIGMHTPSETSSTREDVIRAFEYFREVLGGYPRVYTEHSVDTKRDAQAKEGSRPDSAHYNTDLLNSYGPWVWVDDDCGVPDNRHDRFYDILALNGSPFNTLAAQRYGINKGFLRTGKWREADGDGFLAWYSEENIDSLEENRGLALVYMHLDAKWIDSRTRKMRRAIKDRLTYLASKNGWFVPAGAILDRMEAVYALKLYHSDTVLTIVNTGRRAVEELTIISNQGKSLRRDREIWEPGRDGEIVVGAIHPRESLSFTIA
jgi:hypothetical protein